MIVCTIAAENYLHKAVVLARSVREHASGARLILCVPERIVHPAVIESGLFDVILSLDDLGYENVDQFAFRHSVLELATAIKPRVMRAALALCPDEQVAIYLDPDVLVYGPLHAAEQALQQADILVTPHHVTPPDFRILVPLLRSGAWNLGFLGVRRSSTGLAFLTWLTTTLDTMCYVDPVSGVFVDQKWMDLASSFFDIAVLRDSAYNVGHWNLHARPIALEGGRPAVNGAPLIFFHFSGTDLGRDQRFFLRWAPQGDEPVHGLRRDYKRTIEEVRQHHGFTRAWSYDVYDSGERVAREARLAVRADPRLFERCARPFAQSNEYFLSQSTAP